jgi:hypothetical protein
LLDEIERREQVMTEAIGARHDYRPRMPRPLALNPASRRFQRCPGDGRGSALRQARLGLMKRLERLILQLGDISEIVALGA